jgi:hypothetical protein
MDDLPALTYSRRGAEQDVHLSGEQVGQQGCPAAIRHVNHVDAGHRLTVNSSLLYPQLRELAKGISLFGFL